jgi:hypothetical protein
MFQVGSPFRIFIGIAAMVLVWVAIFELGVAYGQKKYGGTVSTHSSGTTTPGNLAPSEKFLADYANYKTLKQKRDEAEVDLQGAIGRLNAQVPNGFVLDETKMQFIPRPAPAPIPASAKP